MSIESSAAESSDQVAEHAPLDVKSRQLLEALPGPAWIVDCAQLRVLHRNLQACAFSRVDDFVALFNLEMDSGLLRRMHSAEPQVTFQAQLQGEKNHTVLSATLLQGNDSCQRLVLAQPSSFFDVSTQITFDELMDSAFDGMLILDSERRIVQISQRLQEMFGYRVEELRGRTMEILIPPEREEEFDLGQQALNRGGIFHLETTRLRADGSQLEVMVNAQSITSGKFRGGVVVIYRDITETNRNMRYHSVRLEVTRILASETKVEDAAKLLLPALAEILSWDVVRLWLTNKDGLECIFDHYAAGYYCSHDPAVFGSACLSSAEQAVRMRQALWENADACEVALCVNNRHCQVRAGAVAAFPIFDSQRNVLGVLELLAPSHTLPDHSQRDLLEGIVHQLGQFITRCKAEAALVENEAKFRTLAHTAPTAIFIHIDGVLLYANAASNALFGYDAEDIVGRSIWPMFHPEDQAQVHERARRRIQGEEFQSRWESRVVRPNGDVRWIEYSAARITVEKRPAVLVAATDITERRTLEMQLRQTQKMEAIGRLAGGIAHDFNNLLMVIGCSSEVIGERHDLPHEVRQGIDEIRHAADRAAALTRQLLAFSRHQVLAPKVIDLNAVLTGTELILRRALGDDILLSFHLEQTLAPIHADASQLEQVVMNLAVNARDAMPDGGELSVRTFAATLDGTVLYDGKAHMGHYAVLEVSDNGVGMSQDILQHIFEPFFTTKHVGKGTGLGLSTVYGIVQQCGGFVRVESIPERGTTFWIYFPVAALGMMDRAPNGERPAAPVRGTILLVEDQDDVREVLYCCLIRDGHTVIQSSGGAQALEESAAYPGKIDLLLTDVVMSGMSGRELADRLLEQREGIKILYVSGYNEDKVLQKGVIEGQMEFLQKPFTPSVLSQKVRQILSR